MVYKTFSFSKEDFMSNEDSGLFVILTAIGGAVIGALGGALIMNTDTGKKTDAHLSNAYKTVKDNIPGKRLCNSDVIQK